MGPRTLAAYVAAIVVPVAVGAAVIPWRDSLTQSTSLILVLPVLLVALAGGIGPGLLAAASATVAFDLLLTRPYLGFSIHANDDVVAAATLLIVGAAIGAVSSRLARVDTRAGVRRLTIGQFTAFVHTVAEGAAADEKVIHDAGIATTDILGLDHCVWRPGSGPTTAPTILLDGQLMAFMSDLSEDRAQLPNNAELPVFTTYGELGRFVLHPTRAHDVSIEERRAAAAVAQLLAYDLVNREHRPTPRGAAGVTA